MYDFLLPNVFKIAGKTYPKFKKLPRCTLFQSGWFWHKMVKFHDPNEELPALFQFSIQFINSLRCHCYKFCHLTLEWFYLIVVRRGHNTFNCFFASWKIKKMGVFSSYIFEWNDWGNKFFTTQRTSYLFILFSFETCDCKLAFLLLQCYLLNLSFRNWVLLQEGCRRKQFFFNLRESNKQTPQTLEDLYCIRWIL